MPGYRAQRTTRTGNRTLGEFPRLRDAAVVERIKHRAAVCISEGVRRGHHRQHHQLVYGHRAADGSAHPALRTDPDRLDPTLDHAIVRPPPVARGFAQFDGGLIPAGWIEPLQGPCNAILQCLATFVDHARKELYLRRRTRHERDADARRKRLRQCECRCRVLSAVAACRRARKAVVQSQGLRAGVTRHRGNRCRHSGHGGAINAPARQVGKFQIIQRRAAIRIFQCRPGSRELLQHGDRIDGHSAADRTAHRALGNQRDLLHPSLDDSVVRAAPVILRLAQVHAAHVPGDPVIALQRAHQAVLQCLTAAVRHPQRQLDVRRRTRGETQPLARQQRHFQRQPRHHVLSAVAPRRRAGEAVRQPQAARGRMPGCGGQTSHDART